MRWIIGSIILAGCGGGGSSSDDAGGVPKDGDALDVSLDGRISVTSITTPAGVMAGDNNYRIWGQQSLRIAPVFTVPISDGSTLVGYTTGGAATANVARLDTSDQLVETYNLGAGTLRGLAAEPDGHFAALLWDGDQTLRVVRYDADGSNARVTTLSDALAAPTDFNIGESRLEYGDGKYGAYYHVHGISGFANGHEGDQLMWVNAATGAQTTGWQWGCSHSMSELIRYEGGSNKFLTACVTDCFPGTSGDFSTNSIGGVYLDHARKVLDVDAGCNGKVAGELGGLAPHAGGWNLVWSSHQNAATPGQSSYNASTMNQDVAFQRIGTDGKKTGDVVWLTTTPGNEQNTAIATFKPYKDDPDRFLVGWAETAGASRAYKLAIVDAAGAFWEQPLDVTSTLKWGERDDPFRTHTNGDVVWAWFESAGATSFKFARICSGSSAQCRR
ncbi:MAG: hypothetical protein SFX73_02765 [Kofleriaceae bacterium]|nr:hypothetical protein [Kofleriaceae bacterium]